VHALVGVGLSDAAAAGIRLNIVSVYEPGTA
jgi:hypothetical protein